MMKNKTRRRRVMALVLLAATVLLAGCVDIDSLIDELDRIFFESSDTSDVQMEERTESDSESDADERTEKPSSFVFAEPAQEESEETDETDESDKADRVDEASSQEEALPEEYRPPSERERTDTKEAQAPTTVLELNAAALALLDKSNADVKAVNGGAAASYVMYGGTAVADYSGRAVAQPFSFWMIGDQELMWSVLEAESENTMSANIWPDEYIVFLIAAAQDDIPALFGTTGPVSYAMLQENWQQSPTLEYVPAEQGANYAYPMDTWSAQYQWSGLVLDAAFISSGGEYLLYQVLLYKGA